VAIGPNIIIANLRILNHGISAVFANPESWVWWRPNLGISGLQKFIKIALLHFRVIFPLPSPLSSSFRFHMMSRL